MLRIIAAASCGLIAMLTLTACEETYPSPASAQPKPSKTGTGTKMPGWPYTDIETIMMPDGTKCVVLVGPDKGAITCNWGN